MSETPNTITGIKRELLMRLGHDADIFALISLCTREPYVVCDEETFDDEVSYSWMKKRQRKKQQDWQRKSTCNCCKDQWKGYAGILYRSVCVGSKCPGCNR